MDEFKKYIQANRMKFDIEQTPASGEESLLARIRQSTKTRVIKLYRISAAASVILIIFLGSLYFSRTKRVNPSVAVVNSVTVKEIDKAETRKLVDTANQIKENEYRTAPFI